MSETVDDAGCPRYRSLFGLVGSGRVAGQKFRPVPIARTYKKVDETQKY